MSFRSPTNLAFRHQEITFCQFNDDDHRNSFKQHANCLLMLSLNSLKAARNTMPFDENRNLIEAGQSLACSIWSEPAPIDCRGQNNVLY